MFQQTLEKILAEVPGAIAATVMGFDGIAIESRDTSPDFDWQSAAIELGSMASKLSRIAESVEAGNVQSMTVRTDGFATVLRPLSAEYFMSVTLSADGFVGKGQYMLRVLGPKVAAELV